MVATPLTMRAFVALGHHNDRVLAELIDNTLRESGAELLHELTALPRKASATPTCDAPQPASPRAQASRAKRTIVSAALAKGLSSRVSRERTDTISSADVLITDQEAIDQDGSLRGVINSLGKTGAVIIVNGSEQDSSCESTRFEYVQAQSHAEIRRTIRHVVERARLQQQLNARTSFEQLLTSISRSFIGLASQEIDNALSSALARIGQFARVDRSFIFTVPNDDSPTLMTHEWCAPGIESAIGHYHAHPLIQDESLLRRLAQGEPLVISGIEDLPADLNTLRDQMLQRGVCSFILVPMLYENRLLGALGLASLTKALSWEHGEVDLLSFLAQLIVTLMYRRSVEERLSQSERRFQTLLESLGEGVIFCDRDEIILHVNSRMAELCGTSPSQMVGRAALPLLFPTASQVDATAHVNRRLQGFSEKYETPMVRADGSCFEAEVHGTPVYNSKHEIIGTLGVVADITHRVAAARALQESERRYRDLVETSTDLIWSVDRNGAWTFVNQAVRHIYGYEPEEMIGRPFHEFLSKEQALKDQKVFDRILTGEEFLNYETTHYRKDGSPVHLRFNAIALRDAEGRASGAMGTANNVTKHRESQDSLRKSEALLRRYFDNSMIGIGITTPDYRWIEFNSKLSQMLGYSHAELSAKSWPELTHPDDLDTDMAHYQRVLRGELQHYSLEKRYIRKDGTHLHARLSVSGVQSSAGSVEHFVALIQDISEYKNPTAALELQRKFLSQVIDASPNLIFAKDQDGYLTIANRAFAELYGVDSADILGRHISNISDDAQEVQRVLQEDQHVLQSGQQMVIAEGRFVDRRNGSVRWFQTIKTPLRTHSDGSGEVLAVATDITDRKFAEDESMRLQRQLLQSQKMEAIGQLAAGIAHDLNNSLAAVVGHLQLMRIQQHNDDGHGKSIDTALSGCERATSLIEQLLGFARKGKYNLKPVSLQSYVDETVEFLSRVIGSNVTIKTEGETAPLWVLADSGQLQQALTNLIINAKQAMSDGGTITFRFGQQTFANPERYNPRARPGSFAVVSVDDTGSGIAPEHLDKVFEPFFSTKEGSRGTGLGLSMVYGIIQHHGGWIEVASTLGKHTRFTLYIPQVASGQETSEPQDPLMIPYSTGGTVMVVDDERNLVDLARQFLNLSGYTALGFTDPHEALRWYKDHVSDVDLVVLDMKMPKLDGGACFHQLREINPAAKVAILSGYMHDSAAQELLEEGALRFFQKPLRYPELISWITETIRKR